MGDARAASERACVHPDWDSACVIPCSSGFMSLFLVRHHRVTVENKIRLPHRKAYRSGEVFERLGSRKSGCASTACARPNRRCCQSRALVITQPRKCRSCCPGSLTSRMPLVPRFSRWRFQSSTECPTAATVLLRVPDPPRRAGHDNRICRARRNVSSYNELRNVNSSCFSGRVSSRKRRDTCSASPRCRSMASSSVRDRRSCM
jgi:hypothetical protein